MSSQKSKGNVSAEDLIKDIEFNGIQVKRGLTHIDNMLQKLLEDSPLMGCFHPQSPGFCFSIWREDGEVADRAYVVFEKGKWKHLDEGNQNPRKREVLEILTELIGEEYV
jgi:hypothetical protein